MREGSSALSHRNSPTLLFAGDWICNRLSFRSEWQTAGEANVGLADFDSGFYHVTDTDRVDIDINGMAVDRKHIRRIPAGKLRGALQATRFEIDLADCLLPGRQ